MKALRAQKNHRQARGPYNKTYPLTGVVGDTVTVEDADAVAMFATVGRVVYGESFNLKQTSYSVKREATISSCDNFIETKIPNLQQ